MSEQRHIPWADMPDGNQRHIDGSRISLPKGEAPTLGEINKVWADRETGLEIVGKPDQQLLGRFEVRSGPFSVEIEAQLESIQSKHYGISEYLEDRIHGIPYDIAGEERFPVLLLGASGLSGAVAWLDSRGSHAPVHEPPDFDRELVPQVAELALSWAIILLGEGTRWMPHDEYDVLDSPSPPQCEKGLRSIPHWLSKFSVLSEFRLHAGKYLRGDAVALFEGETPIERKRLLLWAIDRGLLQIADVDPEKANTWHEYTMDDGGVSRFDAVFAPYMRSD